MVDLIAEGTILAVYTDESDSNYYLFRASSCPQVLTKDTTDDWGITYGKGSKRLLSIDIGNVTLPPMALFLQLL
jgi:hypothetical protein